MIKRYLLTMALLVIATACSLAADTYRPAYLDLSRLLGTWNVSGIAMIPKTSMMASANGEIIVDTTDTPGRIRTQAIGAGMFSVYRDSTYMTFDSLGSRLVVEYWNSFGMHYLYGGTITQTSDSDSSYYLIRNHDGATYIWSLRFITGDSLQFNFEITEANGKSSKPGKITAVRQKK